MQTQVFVQHFRGGLVRVGPGLLHATLSLDGAQFRSVVTVSDEHRLDPRLRHWTAGRDIVGVAVLFIEEEEMTA